MHPKHKAELDALFAGGQNADTGQALKEAFFHARDSVVRPALEDVKRYLQSRGHDALITLSLDPADRPWSSFPGPSISLAVLLAKENKAPDPLHDDGALVVRAVPGTGEVEAVFQVRSEGDQRQEVSAGQAEAKDVTAATVEGWAVTLLRTILRPGSRP